MTKSFITHVKLVLVFIAMFIFSEIAVAGIITEKIIIKTKCHGTRKYHSSLINATISRLLEEF